ALHVDDDDVLDVVHVPKQSDAADVIRLLAHLEPLSARADVRVLNGLDDLLERYRVALQSIGVHADLELLRLATEAHHVDDTRNLFELALEDPVLGRLEI